MKENFNSKGKNQMNEKKTQEQLRNIFSQNDFGWVSEEEIRDLIKLAKEDQVNQARIHRIIRDNNRVKSEAKKLRDSRTHKLCNVGAAVAKYHPELMDLLPSELEILFREIFDCNRNYADKIVANYFFNRNNKLPISDE